MLSAITCWLPRLIRTWFGTPITVTFDSNTWQMVVRPDKFPKNPKRRHFENLNRAIRCGRIKGYLVDVLATIEAIPRGQRGQYFAGQTLHPGLARILVERLEDARALGFKLIHAPRIGLEIPPEIGSYYVSQSDSEANARQNRASVAIREIETIAIGKNQIEAIGQRIATRLGLFGPWHSFLDRPVDAAENNEIDDAIAEWADEDAVAAHYGYQHKCFCSEDYGKAAVKRFGQSIFDPTHRAWLNTRFGINFVSIEELDRLV
jgi:hypothetical protein